MQTKYSYEEIAKSYKLWMEYVDPSGLQSEEDFNKMTYQERFDFMVGCFGSENEWEIVDNDEHPSQASLNP